MQPIHTALRLFHPIKRAAMGSALTAVAATALSLAGTLPASPVWAAGNTGGFQTYKDTGAGFTLSKPDGWHVRVEGSSIWVESPDKSEALLTEFFRAAPGDTANKWLEKMGDKYGAHFSHADIDSVKPVAGKGDEILATMHYQGPQGAARLRVLCSIVHGKGLLCVMAAPSDRFPAESAKLLHVANSLQFMVPRGTGRSGASSGAGSDSIAAAAQQIHWVKWLDPKDKAFTIMVPQGWSVEGGTLHEQGGGVHMAFAIASPGKDIVVVMGSAVPLGFVAPNQMTMSMGWREGTNNVLHYMRAPEFNAMYLHNIVSRIFDDVVPGKSQESEQASEQQTRMAKQMSGAAAAVSVGITEFKGTNKETGKPVSGVIISSTRQDVLNGLGGPPAVLWNAVPNLIVSQTGDGKDDARMRTAFAVYSHAEQTYTENSTWRANQTQAFNRQTQDFASRSIAKINAIGEQARKNAAANNAAEDAIMGRYHNHVAAQDAQQNAFINFIGDRTDVTDSGGQTYNVGSGYKHYYKNDRTGTIMGTDSAYSPGVDFNPMTEN